MWLESLNWKKLYDIKKIVSEIWFEEMEWIKPIQNRNPWSFFVMKVTDILAALK
jgi:hypothetical protein